MPQSRENDSHDRSQDEPRTVDSAHRRLDIIEPVVDKLIIESATKAEVDDHMAQVMVKIAAVDRKNDAQTAALGRIESTLGTTPDDSTGSDGTGMRGMLARLVRERTFIGQVVRVAGAVVTTIAAIAGIVYAVAKHIEWKP